MRKQGVVALAINPARPVVLLPAIARAVRQELLYMAPSVWRSVLTASTVARMATAEFVHHVTVCARLAMAPLNVSVVPRPNFSTREKMVK